MSEDKEYHDWMKFLEELQTPEGRAAMAKMFESEEKLSELLNDSVQDMIEDEVSE